MRAGTASEPSRTRAEPKIVTAGRSIGSTASKPSAELLGDPRDVARGALRILVAPVEDAGGPPSQPVLRDVRHVHADREQQRERDVRAAEHRALRPAAAPPEPVRRAEDRAAVEEPDRDQVEQVEEEAGEARAPAAGRSPVADADPERDRSRGAARDRPGERDEPVLPGAERAADRDERAEERDEHRQRGLVALPPRLDEVAELVDEDQRDEADAEAPAPEQRVGRRRRGRARRT